MRCLSLYLLISTTLVLLTARPAKPIESASPTTCTATALPQSISAGGPAETLPEIRVECLTAVDEAALHLLDDGLTRSVSVRFSSSVVSRNNRALGNPLLLVNGQPAVRFPEAQAASNTAPMEPIDPVVPDRNTLTWNNVAFRVRSADGADSLRCAGGSCYVRTTLTLAGVAVDASQLSPTATPVSARLTVSEQSAAVAPSTVIRLAFVVAGMTYTVASHQSVYGCGANSVETSLILQELLPGAWGADSRTIHVTFSDIPPGLTIQLPMQAKATPRGGGALSATIAAGDASSAWVSLSGPSPSPSIDYLLDAASDNMLDSIRIPILFSWEDSVRLSGSIGVSALLGDSGHPPFGNPFRFGSTEVITFLPCRTTLLFPLVTNTDQYDTGLSIVNASESWPGTPPHSGSCTISFPERRPTESASPVYRTPPLLPGRQLLFTLSEGLPSSGIPPKPGYKGHLWVDCEFVGARGYAFLTNGYGGEITAAHGYLPEVVISPAPSPIGPLPDAASASPLTPERSRQIAPDPGDATETRIAVVGTSSKIADSEPGVSGNFSRAGPNLPTRTGPRQTTPGGGAHAPTHALGGSDFVTPESIGAASSLDTRISTTDPTSVPLTVIGATNQSAPLQVWRDGNGALASLVTNNGTAFFREIGLASKIGQPVVSQFFETSGIRRFSVSADEHSLRIGRFDDAGRFKDVAMSVSRHGAVNFLGGLRIADDRAPDNTLFLDGAFMDFPFMLTPGPPPAGQLRVFSDQWTQELATIDSNGVVTSLAACPGAPLPAPGNGETQSTRPLRTRGARKDRGPTGVATAENVRPNGPMSAFAARRMSEMAQRVFAESLPAHAASHAVGGMDRLAPAAIGALENAVGVVRSSDAALSALTVTGAAAQSAPLSLWESAAGGRVGLVSPDGRAFFSELGIASKISNTRATEFFEVEGRRRFALSATVADFVIGRFDDAGLFDSFAMQTLRDGGTVLGRELTVLRGSSRLSLGFGALTATAAPRPPTPPTGHSRLFVDAATKGLATIDSESNMTLLGTSAGSPLTDTSNCVWFCRPVWLDSETPEFPVGGTSGELRSGDACGCFSARGLPDRPF